MSKNAFELAADGWVQFTPCVLCHGGEFRGSLDADSGSVDP